MLVKARPIDRLRRTLYTQTQTALTASLSPSSYFVTIARDTRRATTVRECAWTVAKSSCVSPPSPFRLAYLSRTKIYQREFVPQLSRKFQGKFLSEETMTPYPTSGEFFVFCKHPLLLCLSHCYRAITTTKSPKTCFCFLCSGSVHILL